MIAYIVQYTPLKLMFETLWRDEAFSFFLARQNLTAIIATTAQDFNPPLYYLLLHIWMQIFGFSEIALRSLSIVFYCLMVYGGYLFFKNIFCFKKNDILLALVLLITNPFLLYYCFEARMYSLFALLTLFSFYFFYVKKLSFLTVITVLGLYTHYFFVFVIFAQVLYLFVTRTKSYKNFVRHIGIAIALFLPWAVFVFSSVATKTQDFWITKPEVADFVHALSVLYTGYEGKYYDFYAQPIFMTSVFFILCMVYAIKKNIHKNDFKLIAIWALVPYILIILVSLIKPIYTPKYTIFAAVGFALFMIYTIVNSYGKIKVILCAILLTITMHYWYLQLENRSKGPSKQTIATIKLLASGTDPLYITDAASYFTAAYYYGEDHVFIYNSQELSIQYPLPTYIGSILIPQKKIVSFLPEFPRKAFVLKSEREFEIQTVVQ